MSEIRTKQEDQLLCMAQDALAFHLRDQVKVKTDGHRIIEIKVGEMTATLVNKKNPGVIESLMCRFSHHASDKQPKEWQCTRNDQAFTTFNDWGADHAMEFVVMNEALQMAPEVTKDLNQPVEVAIQQRLAKLSPV